MVITLECARCGAALVSSPRLTPGKRARCGVCLSIFPVDLERYASNQLIAGDDDGGGGGDYGGDGEDDDSGKKEDDEKASDEDEEDEEEDDGKGGKKKKKGKGKVEVRSGCGLMSYLITAGVMLALCCICGILGAIFNPTKAPSVVGVWESKDNDGAEVALNFRDGGTGTYTKAGKGQDFKWTTTPPKSLDIDMNEASAKLWTNESKTRFTYDVLGNKLTLTPGTAARKTVTFTKAVEKSKSDEKVDKRDGSDDPKDEPKDSVKKGKGSTGKKKR
jgi:hypothetical protein